VRFCLLTMSLSGRPPRPDKRRERILSSCARGAQPQTHHGPLQARVRSHPTTATVRVRPNHRNWTGHRFQVKRAPEAAIEVDSRLASIATGATAAVPGLLGRAPRPPSKSSVAARASCSAKRRRLQDDTLVNYGSHTAVPSKGIPDSSRR
jgi:hypothetical protein